MLKKKILKAITRQINEEMYSGYLYSSGLFMLDAEMAKRVFVLPAKG